MWGKKKAPNISDSDEKFRQKWESGRTCFGIFVNL